MGVCPCCRGTRREVSRGPGQERQEPLMPKDRNWDEEGGVPDTSPAGPKSPKAQKLEMARGRGGSGHQSRMG